MRSRFILHFALADRIASAVLQLCASEKAKAAQDRILRRLTRALTMLEA
jgi:hypothetical protein